MADPPNPTESIAVTHDSSTYLLYNNDNQPYLSNKPTPSDQPCTTPNDNTASHEKYNEQILMNICSTKSNGPNLHQFLIHTQGLHDCRDTDLQSLSLSIRTSSTSQCLISLPLQPHTDNDEQLISNTLLSDATECELDLQLQSSQPFDITFKYLYSDHSLLAATYTVNGAYSERNAFCRAGGIEIEAFTRRYPVADGCQLVGENRVQCEQTQSAVQVVGSVIGNVNVKKGETDGSLPVDAAFNAHSLLFTFGEVLAIVVFLNFIFCTFVGCKSRKKSFIGYNMIKVIDSEFASDTELDIGIVTVE